MPLGQHRFAWQPRHPIFTPDGSTEALLATSRTTDAIRPLSPTPCHALEETSATAPSRSDGGRWETEAESDGQDGPFRRTANRVGGAFPETLDR